MHISQGRSAVSSKGGQTDHSAFSDDDGYGSYDDDNF